MRQLLKSYLLGFIVSLFLLLPAVGAQAADDLSQLSYDDRSNIELACVLERSNGPVAYNSCVAAQLKMLGDSKAADLSKLSHDDESNIELACVLKRSQGPAAYNECVAGQLSNLGDGRAADL